MTKKTIGVDSDGTSVKLAILYLTKIKNSDIIVL